MPFANTAALGCIPAGCPYYPQLALKNPGFLYEENICLHLLQPLAKNVTGGFASMQIDLQIPLPKFKV